MDFQELEQLAPAGYTGKLKHSAGGENSAAGFFYENLQTGERQAITGKNFCTKTSIFFVGFKVSEPSELRPEGSIIAIFQRVHPTTGETQKYLWFLADLRPSKLYRVFADDERVSFWNTELNIVLNLISLSRANEFHQAGNDRGAEICHLSCSLGAAYDKGLAKGKAHNLNFRIEAQAQYVQAWNNEKKQFPAILEQLPEAAASYPGQPKAYRDKVLELIKPYRLDLDFDPTEAHADLQQPIEQKAPKLTKEQKTQKLQDKIQTYQQHQAEANPDPTTWPNY